MIISTDVEVGIDEFPDDEILDAAFRIIRRELEKPVPHSSLKTINRIRNYFYYGDEYKPSTAARITQSEYEYLPKYGAGQ